MNEVMKKGTANMNRYSHVCTQILDDGMQRMLITYPLGCLAVINLLQLLLRASWEGFYYSQHFTSLGTWDFQLNRLAQILLAIVICQALANVFTCIFQCTPVAGAYGQ